jgi:hypothetical protein
LLKLLLNAEETIPWLTTHLDPGWIAHPVVRRLVERRLAAQADGSWAGLAPLLGELTDPGSQALATEAAADNRGCADAARQIPAVVQRLRDAALDREMAELNRQIAAPDLDDDRKLTLLRRKHELVVARRTPMTPLEAPAPPIRPPA